MTNRKSRPDDDDGARSPIDFGPISNGEFLPRAPDALHVEAERRVHALAEARARKLGISRRAFLASAAGTVTALAVVDELSGCATHAASQDALEHPAAAREELAAAVPDAFVVDVQTHHVEADTNAPWIAKNPEYAAIFKMVSKQRGCSEAEGLHCLARDTYVHEIFGKTEVQVALLSGVPARADENPLGNASIAVTRDLVDRLAPNRLLVEGIVHPNLGPAELDAMDALADNNRIAGWKVYTPWGPDGRGFFLDDADTGIPFLERVNKSKVKRVFLHKGLPWPSFDKKHASPRDIGPAAARFPGVEFICYHCGYEADVEEGPYRADAAGENDAGVDRLITSLRAAHIGAGGNVYGELGGTWQLLMTKPLEAAHVLGKLLLALGEDRLLWGSDALFVGTPQPQIDALRSFQIPEELREKHGYPALTADVKRKILGDNAVKLLGIDVAAHRNKVALELPRDLVAPPFGPRTRRELFASFARHGGHP